MMMQAKVLTMDEDGNDKMINYAFRPDDVATIEQVEDDLVVLTFEDDSEIKVVGTFDDIFSKIAMHTGGAVA